MESSKNAYFTFKYGLLLLGVLFTLFPILCFVSLENITYNGKPGPPPLWDLVEIMLIGLLIIALNLLLQRKLYFASLGGQKVRLQNGKRVVEENWMEVDSVKLIPIVFPPLYKITFKNREGYFLFTSGQFGINLFGFTIDWSDMGSLIKKKKRELGI
ncbi:hypothetical protein Q0590_36185 [Rhodocytophaga aerolata]|uniref:PH domain-containing protein n=1 Tax=Rhodocytophaga aerolata TaxID=455078 RepID=A0ABT8RI59_9BACT|nr:hypothetical protein [Rhodocytophaga aerolata]MDO1451770.1 hypothetical protein [Rhodocytophaga aerolata]